MVASASPELADGGADVATVSSYHCTGADRADRLVDLIPQALDRVGSLEAVARVGAGAVKPKAVYRSVFGQDLGHHANLALDELGAARTFGLVGTNSDEFAYVGESGAALSRHGAGIENILGLIVFFSHLGKLISAESRHTNGFIFRM